MNAATSSSLATGTGYSRSSSTACPHLLQHESDSLLALGRAFRLVELLAKTLGESLEQVADLLFLESLKSLDEVRESQAPDLDVGRGHNQPHPVHHLRGQDPGQLGDPRGRDHVEQGLDARFSTVLQDLPNRLLRDPLAEEIGRLSDSLADRLGLRLGWLRLTVPVADGAPGVFEGFRRI